MDSCCIPTGWLSLPLMETLSSHGGLPHIRLTCFLPVILQCSPQVQIFNKFGQFLRKFGADWCAAATSRRCRQPLGQDHGRRVQSDERRHLWHGRQCPRQVFSFQVGAWLGVKCLVNLMCFWLVSYWLLLQAPWIPQRRGSEWQPGDVY